MRSDLFTLCLCKGRERYILLVDHATRGEAIRTLGRWAANADLSLSWHDAAVLCKRLREIPEPAVEFRDSRR